MCGISGIFQPNQTINSTIVQQMNRAMSHRGPDADGVWSEPSIGLGHRRLSIIDLSEAGNQPMLSPDGRFVIVFNGEIYNFQELKAELADYKYKSNTDTELILSAFSEWGIACLERLNGMFAFAIWDRHKKELIVARDRLGIKPLYYWQDKEGLIFASELRALLASGLVPKKLALNGLIDYLRYQTVLPPHTILEDVYLLEPGCYLKLDIEETQKKQYWSPLRAAVPVRVDEEGTKKQIYDTLLKSVQRRLIADVPFGAFLSGGIDSSIVVGLMAKVSNQPVQTFNISFAEERFSEAKYARIIAQKFNTKHQEILLSPDHFLANLPIALNAMDHPSGDGPNTFIVSKVTKEAGISMALSGLGGDELFAGYPIFKQSVQLQRLQAINWLPSLLRKGIGNMLHAVRPSVATNKIQSILKQERVDPLVAYPLARQALLDSQIQELLTVGILPKKSVELFLESVTQQPSFQALPLLSQVSIAEFGSYMQPVLLRDTDQMSMAHALEVRTPFLDHELVELVLGVSDQLKYPHTPKQLLVETVRNLLPNEVVNRPKMGFVLPFQDWMKGPLLDFCQEKLEIIAHLPHFRSDIVMKKWEAFQKNSPIIKWTHLWLLVVLGHWIQQNQID